MQSTVLFCLLALTFHLVLVLGLLFWIEISEAIILQDEVAYQESEISRLEALVKRKNYILTLEHDNILLLAREIVRGKSSRVWRGVTESDIDDGTICEGEGYTTTEHEDALSAEIQQQNTCIEQLNARIEELEKKHDEEKTGRTVTESMKWALEEENDELKQTIAELRRSTQNTTQQRSVVEKGQAAAIQTLQNCIKTAARLSAEQTTRIQVLEERIAEKDAETEEVAMRRTTALRRANRHYVKDLKKKWALGELTKVDDSVVSIAQIFEVEERGVDDEEEADDGAQDMSMCSVLQEEVQRQCPPSPGQAQGAAVHHHHRDKTSLDRQSIKTCYSTSCSQIRALLQPSRLALCFCYEFGAVCARGDEDVEG
ncbi:hypothetical protein C8F04DRAFT_1392531 [Mycena alexandri]|uniref:Uncharacterized protein n=1 Tax=Mycena alexandri TaxID=1745969 RepID=A0AAD6T826_9AGAR|nr:hypothetical protein C8F04DRAFT_1392531 [Mycena alexandri]